MHVYRPPCSLLADGASAAEPLRRPASVLTPLGAVAIQVIRLGYALEDLAGEDRTYIVGMLRELLEDAGACAAASRPPVSPDRAAGRARPPGHADD